MHYHDLLNLSNPQPIKALNTLHTGWYRFNYQNGYVTGKVLRIGDHKVLVDVQFMGLREIGVMEFLDSSPVKI